MRNDYYGAFDQERIEGEKPLREGEHRSPFQIDRDRIILETLTGIRRAGADIIITYHALDAAKLLAR